MSSNNGTQPRNPARRVFAAEFQDATHQERQGNSDRAPRYQLLPTGEWANRVFIIGTLTEVEEHEDNDQYVKGELRDPTGRFMIDAGQYQDKARAHMRRIDAPEYVAVTGKASSFEGERGRVTKVRVELITEVPAGLYDHWVAEAAARTGKRLEQYGNDDNEAAAKAEEIYGPDLNQYHQAAIEAIKSNKEDIEQDGTVQNETEEQNAQEATAESPSD